MGLDLTSLAIQVTSTGISEAAKALDSLVTSANSAEKAFPGLKVAAEALNASQKSSIDVVTKLLDKMEKQADLLGKNQASINAYNAAAKGATQAEIEWARALGAEVDAQVAATKALKEAEAAAKKAAGSVHEFSLVTAGSTRELIVLGHEIMVGNFSRIPGSMLVMAERINFLPKAFAAVKTAAMELGVSLGVLLGVVTAVVAVIGAIGFAFYKGASEQKAFNDALIQTGNYAGTTGLSLDRMAHSAAASGGSLGDAKKAAIELAASGKFTADQIGLIAQAAVLTEKAFGKSIDTTIKEFETLATEAVTSGKASTDVISKHTLTLNEHYHFLTVAQFEAISNLEKTGHAAEAANVAEEAFAKSQISRAQESIANLGYIARAWYAIKEAIGSAWDALENFGKKDTLNDQIKQAKANLNAIYTDNNLSAKALASLHESLSQKLVDLYAQKNAGILAAEKAGLKAREDQDTMFAEHRIRAIREQYDKQSAAIRALAEFDADIQKTSQADQLANAEGNARARIELVKKTHDKIAKLPAEGMARANAEIAAAEEIFRTQNEMLNESVRLEKSANKNKEASAQELYNVEKTNSDKRAELIQTTFQKEMSATEDYDHSAKNSAELALAAATKRSEIESKYTLLALKNNNDLVMAQDELRRAKEAYLIADEKAFRKEILSIETSTQAIMTKIEAYNLLPDAVKAAGVSEKQMADYATQAQINFAKEQLADLEKFGEDASQAVAEAKAKIDALISHRDAQSDLEAIEKFNSDAQKATAAAEAAWKSADKTIEDGLYKAISEGGGNAFKKLLSDVKQWFARLILQPIVAPIAAFGASFLDPTAASAQGNAGAGVGGSIGSAQTAYSMYSAISKGFDGISTSITNSLDNAYNAFRGTSGVYGPTQAGGNIYSGAPGSGTIGTGASYAAGAYTGKTLGTAISGQYGIGDHGSAVVNIGTAIGAMWGPLGAAIGGAIGGLVNRAFGMGPKDITSQGLRGTVGDSGTTATNYANWHQNGGWFRSDKSGTDTSAASADVVNSLTSGLGQMKAVSTDFAKSLNVNADALQNYSKNFDITLTTDAAANQKAITDFFTTMGDDMATKLIPNIASFARVGETASVTLQRLSETFTATNAIADLLGRSVEQTFGSIGLDSDAARERLINLAGGIQALGAQTTFYAQNFLTEAEKIAPVQKAVTKALGDMGLSGITTIEQFKGIVDSLDLTTQAGAEEYTSLMKLAPAFKAVADYATQAIQATDILNKQHELDLTLLEATGHAAEAAAIRRQDELDALLKLSPALEATQRAINAALDATAAREGLKTNASNDFNILSKSIAMAKEASTAAFDAQTVSFNNFKTSTEEAIKTTTAANAELGNLTSALKSSLSTIQPLTREQGQQVILNALNVAKATGVLPKADDIKDALSAINKQDPNAYATLLDAGRDAQITANNVSGLNTLATSAKSISDMQLTALQQALTTAEDNYKLAQDAYDAEQKQYDLVLKFAQDQLDALNGTQLAVVSVKDALSSFTISVNTAISAQRVAGIIAQPGATVLPGQQSSPQSATASQVTQLFQALLGRDPRAAGLSFYTGTGESASSVANSIMHSAEYASLHGSHADGLDRVPFDNYRANLHVGERVQTARAAKDSDKTAEEVRQLRSDMEAQNLAIIQATKATEKIVRLWDGNGMPPTRTNT